MTFEQWQAARALDPTLPVLQPLTGQARQDWRNDLGADELKEAWRAERGNAWERERYGR